MGCKACPPGQKRLTTCGEGVDQCTVCTRGEFAAKYHTSTQCQACRTWCSVTYQVVVKPCKTTADIRCECKQGYFLESSADSACTSHTKCPPGHGVSQKGTPIENTKCMPCSKGYFSSHDSSTEECLQWTDCSQYGDVRVAGDATKDNICHNQQFTGLPPLYIAVIALGSFLLLMLVILTIYCKKRRNGFWESASGKLRRIISKNKTRLSRSGTPLNNLGGSLNIQTSQNMMSQNSTINNLSLYQSSQGFSLPTSRMSSTHDFNRLDECEDKFLNLPAKADAMQQDVTHHEGPRPSSNGLVFRMTSDASAGSLEAVISQPLLNQPPPGYGEVLPEDV